MFGIHVILNQNSHLFLLINPIPRHLSLPDPVCDGLRSVTVTLDLSPDNDIISYTVV